MNEHKSKVRGKIRPVRMLPAFKVLHSDLVALCQVEKGNTLLSNVTQEQTCHLDCPTPSGIGPFGCKYDMPISSYTFGIG